MGVTALARGQGLEGIGQTAGPADFYGVMTPAEETDLCDAIRFVVGTINIMIGMTESNITALFIFL